MKKSNRKGFTIVELVIVIAVIAILAAVLIPTFASIIRKANISNDTMLAKNLNTALTAEEAISGEPEDFDEVISILRANGFIIANLNPSADECYFVWESSTNQILLVDGKDDYKVIFSAKEGYAEIGETWNFAIGDPDEQKAVAEDLADKNVSFRTTISNAKDLSTALENGGIIYLDDSVEISKNNVIKVGSDNDTVINLGNSALNTNGVIDVVPVVINKTGTKGATIKGGIIGAAGESISADNKEVAVSIFAADGTKLVVDGTQINMTSTAMGYVNLAGDANFKDAKIDSTYMGLGIYGDSQTVLEDTTITSSGRCVFVSNYLKKYDENGATVLDSNGKAIVLKNHGGDTAGTAKLTIKSGNYHGKYVADTGNKVYAPIVAYSGDIVISGGTFTSGANNNKPIFDVMEENGSIVITGGTFNGKSFSSITTVDQWKALCDGCSVAISADGKTVTLTK